MIEQLAGVLGRDVPRGTTDLLGHYMALLRDETGKQNLISSSTLDSLWERHILDGAQLVKFAPAANSSWVDIGSGAGLPGIVIAILVGGPVTLIEPRRLRAAFLTTTVAELGLDSRVTVAAKKVERVAGAFDVITARAVAELDKLLRISTHLSTRKSLWVLPKGRSAESELAAARRNWHCDAEIVLSRTDPDSRILLLRNVKARGGR
jgi:16S rRNA (guanine527-N7)-methyltransferase